MLTPNRWMLQQRSKHPSCKIHLATSPCLRNAHSMRLILQILGISIVSCLHSGSKLIMGMQDQYSLNPRSQVERTYTLCNSVIRPIYPPVFVKCIRKEIIIRCWRNFVYLHGFWKRHKLQHLYECCSPLQSTCLSIVCYGKPALVHQQRRVDYQKFGTSAHQWC